MVWAKSRAGRAKVAQVAAKIMRHWQWILGFNDGPDNIATTFMHARSNVLFQPMSIGIGDLFHNAGIHNESGRC